ncbi:MAG: flavin reductase family protein [Synergistota bacterium]|nr:flavin reductase family protein [Synergistota bacterium]
MKKVEANLRTCLQPAPKVIVSCRDSEGNNNALAVAYCCNCSYDPPMIMVGIVPSRHSYKIIKETGAFVVNVPSKDQKKIFDYLGSHSGRDEDKFSRLSLRTEEGKAVNAPLLTDCPICIECRVEASILTGSHEMFAGKIERIHVDEHLVDEKGNIDYSKIDQI